VIAVALIRRVWGSRHVPVYRSSFALMATTVANAVFGVLFWIAAAQLYPADVVGLGAGGISALQLVCVLGWVGLQFTLLRYVPAAGTERGRLVMRVYFAGATLTLLGAVVFLAGLADRLGVGYINDSALGITMFCVGAVAWVVFSLQDAVLTALRRAGLVAGENLLFGLVKLILLVVLSAVVKPWTLLGVWAGSAAVFVIGINAMISRRLRSDAAPSADIPSTGAIARFSLGHTAAATLAWLPDFLVPLLVITYLGAEANAYYFTAWTVGASVRFLAVNIANAVIVEASYEPGATAGLLRSGARLAIIVLLPAVVVMLVGASVILRIFGEAYADAGAPLLRWLAVSVVPFTIVTLIIARGRVRERFGDAVLIMSVSTVTVIGADVVLIPEQGIEGAGMGWLAGQLVAMVVALWTLRRDSGGLTGPLGRAEAAPLGKSPEVGERPGDDPAALGARQPGREVL